MWRQRLGPYPRSTEAKNRWWKKAARLDWKKFSRKDILSFLQWNDPNGRYTDQAAKDEGMESLSKQEALEYLHDVLIEGAGPSAVLKNPGPTTKQQGMLMGSLQSIEIKLNDTGEKATIKGRGKFLGYLPRTRTLCIMQKSRGNPGKLSKGITKLHRQFHNAGHTKVAVYDWPNPQGRKKNIGRIVALTYAIPKGMKSPDKKNYLWHHEFGDHGERGHGPVRGSGHYPTKLQPMLQMDDAGNLYIKRMPGNKFYVTDWLYW